MNFMRGCLWPQCLPHNATQHTTSMDFPSAESRYEALRLKEDEAARKDKERVEKVCSLLRERVLYFLHCLNKDVYSILDSDRVMYGRSVAALVVIDSDGLDGGVITVTVRKDSPDVPYKWPDIVNEYVQGELKTKLIAAGYDVVTEAFRDDRHEIELWRTSISFPVPA